VVNKTGPGASVEVATLIWKHTRYVAHPLFKVIVDADAVKVALKIPVTFTIPLRR
jgi:hypothetical protein